MKPLSKTPVAPAFAETVRTARAVAVVAMDGTLANRLLRVNSVVM